MKQLTCLKMASAMIAVQMVLAQSAFAQSDQTQASSGGGVEEIIVTAQRREQNLQTVPIAVSAVTAAAAERIGVTGTATLVAAAPGLEVTKNGNSANIFLRGVGYFGGNPNDEPSVAMYIDGVYYPAPNGNFFDYNNIERLEVLKGPQGTLFGRNATAGVIQIITKNPTFEPTLSANVGYANYDTISGDVYASTGLGEKAAINFAAQGKDQRNGWGKNLTTGEDTYKNSNYSFRSKLLLQPTEKLELLLSGNYSWTKTPAVTGSPPPGATNIIGQPYPGRFNFYGETTDYGTAKTWGGSLRVDYDAGPVKITSITAYNRVNGFFALDQDNSPLKVVQADLTSRNRMFTQEIQFGSTSESSFDWLVGAYYYRYKAGYDPLSLTSDLDPATNFDFVTNQRTESLAVFGQATIPITDTTNFTVGARYTTEDQKYFSQLELPNSSTVIVGPARGKQSFEKLTWRFSLDQKLSDDVMVYASFNRGFKSGGYSLVTPPGSFPPYKPEVLDAYEVGFKSTLADRRIRLNGAAYYYDYSNIQVQQIQPGLAYTVNGASAEIYGAELEAQFALSENLNLFASGAYVHTKYKKFDNAPRFDRIPASGILPPLCTPPLAPQPPGTNCTVSGTSAAGNRLSFAPKWTYNVGGDYTIPTSMGKFVLAGNVYYNDGSFATPDNRLQNPSYYNVNASISWTSPDEHFGVTIWGRNLANEYYYALAIEQSGPFGDIQTGAEPRTYGIKLSYKY